MCYPNTFLGFSVSFDTVLSLPDPVAQRWPIQLKIHTHDMHNVLKRCMQFIHIP